MRNGINRIPIVTLDGIVILPGMLMHFDTPDGKSIEAIKNAMNDDQIVFLTTQRKLKLENPDNDINQIGIVAQIKHYIKLPDNSVRVLIEGMERARIIQPLETHMPFYSGDVEIIKDESENSLTLSEKEAMLRGLREIFEIYAKEIGTIGNETIQQIVSIVNIDKMVDRITLDISLTVEQKQVILETVDLIERYERLVLFLNQEIEILRIKKEYQKKVKEKLEKNQKEYILKEQLKMIQEELGNGGSPDDINDYYTAVDTLNASKEIKDKVLSQINRLKSLSYHSAESTVQRSYIELLLALPWDKVSQENENLDNAEKVLDEDHYGLEKVKARIMEFLAVRTLTKKGRNPIICLVGPPGTGKTSIAKSIARALNKKYVKISLGGVRDEAEIRGHRRTYVGALPGRLITALKSAGTKNPLILFDEIDKVSSDYKGDTSSALLEVLDGEQNNNFVDHYVEIPVDLSEVLFLCTANSLRNISKPLLDRLEVIEVSSYTINEKMHIGKDFLIKKQREINGLLHNQIKITDKALMKVITGYTKEAGVRNLERKIGELCRKAAKEIVLENNSGVRINVRNLEKYLGKERYTYQEANKKDEIGIVRGLAWTNVGGATIEIEVNAMPGKGKFDITGQIGNVMQESAKAGISYIRSVSKKFQISPDYFEKHDIHIHIPEGAVPKDGPSAGISITTAMLSAMTHKKVRADVAMTGEITIRGRVLPIGGLKEKILAAKTAKIKTVIIPEENKKDMEEISSEIKEGINIKFVSYMDEVLSHALV